MQAQDFAAAHAGAEHDLEQVGELVRVVVNVVPQERRRLLRGPAEALLGAGPGRHGVPGRVVPQPPGAHRDVQRVAQGRDGPVDSHASSAGGELGGDPVVDVPGTQVRQAPVAESGDQVALHARLIAGVGVRGEVRLPRAQPLAQEGSHGGAAVLVDTAQLPVQHAGHLAGRGGVAGEATPPARTTTAVLRRQVNGVRPRPVPRVLQQPHTPRTELLPVGTLAAAPPVDPAPLHTLPHERLHLGPVIAGPRFTRRPGAAAEREGRCARHPGLISDDTLRTTRRLDDHHVRPVGSRP